ncbi:MAG TPA: VWA domain-containing protein [Bryobacteraceae bacterium]|nr:VWA domain-containing protein [Bryobacteraceae bacterium]
MSTLYVLMAVCLAQPAIRVDVQLVTVSVTVRDEHGALVTGLSQGDFELIEDGIPQKIAYFTLSSQVPLQLGLLVDVSGSQDHFSKQHRSDLERFLRDVLGPDDRAFLLCFANHLRLASDLTASPQEILDGLQRFEKEGRHLPELGPAEIREGGTAFYDSIYYGVTEKLVSVDKGRRALVIFSDGEDNASAHHMLDAIESAQSADVLLYGIRYTETRKGKLTARNKYGIRVMDRLALETGARAFDAAKGDLSDFFRQIGEELRSSYEIGYYSTNSAKDSSFRKISLRVKRPGLAARSKTGYFVR